MWSKPSQMQYKEMSLIQDTPELIGCIVCQERSTDGSDSTGPVVIEHFLYSHVLYILNIAVSEEYRKRGIGTMLLRKCFELCDQDDLCAGVVLATLDCLQVYLHVLTTNSESIHFYEVNGFLKVQRCPGTCMDDYC